ncbi:MAG: hypothetical protein EB054_05690 [Actinobacteria bacterium]|nr:hypothetical protein [Actinomycetota bacterium]
MTRKDYVLLAKAINNALDEIEGSSELSEDPFKSVRLVVTSIATALESENPRFDYQKFISASYATQAHREAVLAQLR